MMDNWVCLDCGRDGLAITDMFTEVPMLETEDGRPVGSCQKCQEGFEYELGTHLEKERRADADL